MSESSTEIKDCSKTRYAWLHVDHHLAYQGFGPLYESDEERTVALEHSRTEAAKWHKQSEFDNKECVLRHQHSKLLAECSKDFVNQDVWIFGFTVSLTPTQLVSADTTMVAVKNGELLDYSDELFDLLCKAAQKRATVLKLGKIRF